jgi:hypothetical protein
VVIEVRRAQTVGVIAIRRWHAHDDWLTSSAWGAQATRTHRKLEIGDEAHTAVSHAILTNSALFAEVEVKGVDCVLYHAKVLDVGGELEMWGEEE